MRYYKITVDGKVLFTSFVNGKTDPGALNVELDILQSIEAIPGSSSYVRIWGIPIEMISQSKNFNKKSITVEVGMQKGLPLANPRQIGVVAQGTIYPALGNWIGTDMTLDFIFGPSWGQPDSPNNISLNWKQGTKLSDALATMLPIAFPGYTPVVNVSPNLVLPYDVQSSFETVGQLSRFLMETSQRILGSSSYAGVNISQSGTQITVSDGTTQKSAPLQINFQDLIGQPTWINPNEIQFKAVMRGDMNISQQIIMPKQTFSIATPKFALQPRSQSIFQGTFQLTQIRHIGNFRNPDAAAWNTTVNAVQPSSGGQQ